MTDETAARRAHGFFSLGFDQVEEVEASDPTTDDHFQKGQRPLRLGRRKSTLPMQVGAWVSAALGIFSRQGLALPSLSWTLANVSTGALIASLVVSLAVFPAMMRWFNSRHRRVGFEQIAVPFSFGFFLDLAVVAAVHIPKAVIETFAASGGS